MEQEPAVFLDRDGVINPLVCYEGKWVSPRTLADFQIYWGVKSVVTSLKKKGYKKVIVATNQPGLFYGDFSYEVYECMCQQLRSIGIDDIFTCDHALDSSCDCRKPKHGLLLAAAKKHGICLGRSYFVGDNDTDMQAAAAAGCEGILLRTLLNVRVPAKREIGMLGMLPKTVRTLSPKPA